MVRKGILVKLLLSYFLPLLVLLLYSSVSIRITSSALQKSTEKNVENGIVLVKRILSGSVDPDASEGTSSLLKRVSQELNFDITLIDEKGKVIAGFHHDEENENNGSYISKTAEIILNNGRVGLLTVGTGILYIDETLVLLRSRLLLFAALSVLLVITASLLFSRNLFTSLLSLDRQLQGLKNRDFTESSLLGHPSETRFLFETMETVKESLKKQMTVISNENKQSNAVLASMVEPVILLDTKLQIRACNAATCRLVNLYKEQIIGKNILEIIRNSELQEFAQSAFESSRPIETNITIYQSGFQGTNGKQDVGKPGSHIFLQAHATVIPEDEQGGSAGVLLVFNDISKLKTLENIRKDFVANVSHELKTPITSIKGFVETLLSGAIHHPEKAEHFLNIIAKQTDRLNSIIEDLLSLSRLEQFKRKQLEFEYYSIAKIMTGAVYVCRNSAEKKKIDIHLDLDERIKGYVNPLLLEQAIVNLIDNAIKYSDHGSSIHIMLSTENEEYYVIAVEDHGCGIPTKHLSRVFERFYRVDKARSRELGGTGLGLAIVKHIASVHQGEVTVKSIPNEGSTFSILLPVHTPEMNTQRY